MRTIALLKSRFKNHGGLEKYASRIAEAFQKQGDQVTVITTGKNPPPGPIPVVATQTTPWPGFIRMQQFDLFAQKWLKAHPQDIVFGMDRNRFQTHMRAGNGVHAAYLKSRFFTDPLSKAILCRFNPLHRMILKMEKEAFENPKLKKVFTNSFMVRDQILEYYKTDPEKIQVIHNGVEWHEMERDFQNWESERWNAFKRFSLDPSQLQLLFIGNGYSRKGLNQLLFALSQIKNEPFQLSVIGKENKIDLYRAKAVKLGLEKKVVFFGPSPSIRSFYQLADVLIIPSFYDPFANVTIEALAMGLFVVSSKRNGGSEILNTFNGSIIEDLLNPDSMIQSLKIALKNKKTARSATLIRQGVKDYDFSKQMKVLIGSL